MLDFHSIYLDFFFIRFHLFVCQYVDIFNIKSNISSDSFLFGHSMELILPFYDFDSFNQSNTRSSIITNEAK